MRNNGSGRTSRPANERLEASNLANWRRRLSTVCVPCNSYEAELMGYERRKSRTISAGAEQVQSAGFGDLT